MAKPLIMALDQGTTSTRAILFDLQGRAVAEAGRPLAQHYPCLLYTSPSPRDS